MFSKFFAESYAEAAAVAAHLAEMGAYCVEINYNLSVSWLGDTEIVWEMVEFEEEE